MKQGTLKQARRVRRRAGIRKRVTGTPQRPRLTVYRSLKHMYAQIVDDLGSSTLVSANSVQAKLPKGGDVEGARAVGRLLAERAKAAGIQQVSFDRGGFRYHGRIKALAEAVREGGLKF